jgi:transketolase
LNVLNLTLILALLYWINIMETKLLANKIRIHALKMTSTGGSSHIGAILSAADILAVLYNKILNIYPEYPKSDKRDRFIMSKGHAGAGVYAALAESGFFPVEKLKTHYQDGSDLSGHVSHKGIPGVELSTGSLGHGLSVASGMALAAKKDNKFHRVFALLSDGECDEGSTWEAVMFSAFHKLDNLIAIIDYNKMQAMGFTAKTLNLEPFADKWKAFGWECIEANGHDTEELIEKMQYIPLVKGKPTVIIAHTVKGKGVSFMENDILWHYRCARGEEFDAALKELEDYAG